MAALHCTEDDVFARARRVLGELETETDEGPAHVLVAFEQGGFNSMLAEAARAFAEFGGSPTTADVLTAIEVVATIEAAFGPYIEAARRFSNRRAA